MNSIVVMDILLLMLEISFRNELLIVDIEIVKESILFCLLWYLLAIIRGYIFSKYKW